MHLSPKSGLPVPLVPLVITSMPASTAVNLTVLLGIRCRSTATLAAAAAVLMPSSWRRAITLYLCAHPQTAFYLRGCVTLRQLCQQCLHTLFAHSRYSTHKQSTNSSKSTQSLVQVIRSYRSLSACGLSAHVPKINFHGPSNPLNIYIYIYIYNAVYLSVSFSRPICVVFYLRAE